MLAQQRQAAILERVRGDGGVRVAHLVARVRRLRHDDPPRPRGRWPSAAWSRRSTAAPHRCRAARPTSPGSPPSRCASSRRRPRSPAPPPRWSAPGTAIALSAGTTTARPRPPPGRRAAADRRHQLDPGRRLFYRADRADRTVVLTGGVRTPSDALVGPVAVAAMRSLHVDMLFLGVHGMSDRAGFTTPNLMEAETNRALVDQRRATLVVRRRPHQMGHRRHLARSPRWARPHVSSPTRASTPTCANTLAEQVGELSDRSRPNGEAR